MDNQTEFRPMRRFKQALPPKECTAILETAYRGFLSVIGDGGYPYTIPINFVFTDGKLYFHCTKEGHKLDAIRSCDKACFTVIDDPVKEPDSWWDHVRSVICFGRIRIMEDQEEIVAMSRELCAKFPATPEEIEGMVHRSGARVGGLELTIEHMTGKRVHEK